ncbi:hypothetical protein JCM11251_002841 [Rhodosporidiobolus azoricus]
MAATASPLPLHLRQFSTRSHPTPSIPLLLPGSHPVLPPTDDSSLSSALGMRTASSREPSPWSKFLSPSLFAFEPGQRSSPLPAVAPPTPSPLKQVQNHPSLFTHAKEINPFEQSFSHLSTTGQLNEVGRSGVAESGEGFHGDAAAMQLRAKRKRANSSPALFTPGGTGEPIGETTKEAFLHQAKRPSLRLAVQNGLPAHMVTAASLAPSESTLSFRSSTTSSFDETTSGSSFLRHRRGQSLTHTVSPDSSIAPSPHSTKELSPFPPQPQPYAHFQPAPMPFSMPPPVPGSVPYADPHAFAGTLAPAAMGVEAIAPLPYAPQGPATTFAPLPHLAAASDPTFAFPPQPIPADPYTIPPYVPSATTLPLSTIADPNGLVMAAQVPYPVIPTTTLAPSNTLPLGPVVAPLPMIPAPLNASTSSNTTTTAAAPPTPPAGKKPSTSKPPKPAFPTSTSSSTSLTLGPDGQPAPIAASGSKPKPPGKKRGRKPKNWDPTLERTVELDPEEQERQRKLALERNRVAASKSRRRKKERVELLETAATDLCTRNLSLQADCRALLAEVHSLRAFMTQTHPAGCPCVHVNGYLARETDGGGIPAILYGAGATLDRDYSKVPKWGADDDVFEGIVEHAALEALAAGGSLTGMVPGMGMGMSGVSGVSGGGSSSAVAKGKKKAKDAAEAAARAVAEQIKANARTGGSGVGMSTIPVVGGGMGAGGGIPLKAVVGSGAVRAVSEENEDDEGDSDDEDEDQEDEMVSSEEERIELKSRRARQITAKSQRD